MSSYDHSLRKSVSAPEIHKEEDDEPEAFESVEAEAEYYKSKYQEILETLNETRQELDEFQSSSKELEDELERELRAAEDGKKSLEDRISDLEASVFEWKEKYASLQKQYNSSSESMQREIDNLRSERDKAQKAVVDLEQGNDDLERNQRNAMSSLLDLESKHNRLLEEKIMLEEDLLAKSSLQVEVQRLKDELRDQAEEMEMLRLQSLKNAPDTPPSVMVPLTRPEFMSPVAEASFETSSINTPATFASTPAVAQRHADRAQGAGSAFAMSPSTPARAPLSASRRHLDGNSSPRTGSPAGGGIKRSNTIHNFESPTPLQGSNLARSTNQGLKQVSNIPLGKTVTMKNFQGALGLNAARAGSPLGSRAMPSPARTTTSGALNSSTSSSRQDTNAPQRTKLFRDVHANISRMRGKLDRVSKPKDLPKSSTAASTSTFPRSLAMGRSSRATPLQQSQSSHTSPSRASRNLPTYTDEDRGDEVASGSTPPGWTLVQTPAYEANVTDYASQDRQPTHEGDSENGSTSSKAVPSRSRIPSALGVSMGPNSKIRQHLGRAVSRVSSGGTSATASSSVSDGNRPETPALSQHVPPPKIEADRSRPPSTQSHRPESAMSNRPSSRAKVRPPLPDSLTRPASNIPARPASAQASRGDALQASASRSRRAAVPSERPRPMSIADSPSARIARPTTPSSARPHSRNELSRSVMSPGRAHAKTPVSGIPESPVRATKALEESVTPGSMLTRSHRRVSLNEPTPSRIPRRSLSGRPTPSDVAKSRAEPAPPVPALSLEHQREVALRRTPGAIGLGLPSRPGSRSQA